MTRPGVGSRTRDMGTAHRSAPPGRGAILAAPGDSARPGSEEHDMPGTASTVAENKRLAVRWLELVSDGDLEEMYRLTSPTWTMEGGPPDLPGGHEGLRVLFAHFGEIDQKWTVDDVIGEGDTVVVRATNTCEQESFFGVPGRGIRQVFTATFTMQIVDGRIARTWRNAADLQRLFQLGARILPPAPLRPSMP